MGVLYAKVNGVWEPIVSAVTGDFLPLAGGTLTGPLILPGPDSTNANAAMRKSYIDAQVATRLTQAAADALYVNVTGDNMSGQLRVGGDPTTSPPGVLLTASEGRMFSACNGSTGVLAANLGLGRGGTPGGANGRYVAFNRGAADNDPMGVLVGSIAIGTGGSTVVYNTSSDYRLKDDLGPITAALGRVAALAPKRIRWKETGHECDGFMAHEVAEVMPELVTGAKDALDDGGNIDPQQLDVPGIVPVLVAAVQELSAEVTTLRAEVNALKGAA